MLVTTHRITLDDDTLARLQRVADAEHVSIEAVVAAAAAERAARVSAVSADFQQLADELVSTYKPLLDGLA